MQIKTLSTVIHDFDQQAATLNYAIAVARTLNAHLSVYAIGVDETEPGFYYAGAQTVVVTANYEAAQEQEAQQQSAARERLAASGIQWDISGLVLQYGTLSATIGDRLRFSDLVVLSAPFVQDRHRVAEAVAEAALFNGNVPTLFVPPGMSSDAPEVSIGRILVAWNDSDQALAAVRAASGFFAGVDLVDITLIDPSTTGPDRSDPGGRIAHMVARQGARAEISVLAGDGKPIAEQLRQRAQETGADLIVMGAYGHSRMREAIFGGATRHMLQSVSVPTLMAH